MKEKIAIIGSGISGLSAGFFLSNKYDIFLYEKNDYLGGHTRTKKIYYEGAEFDIDTGFIVFNDSNYPDFNDFIDLLNVKTANSKMSFSVSIKNPDFEYGGKNFNTLFAQRKNLFSIPFLFFIIEIFKFYRKCKNISKYDLEKYTVKDFLDKNNYSNFFRDFHIYPMLSSIWSSDTSQVKEFPLKSFIDFFDNHGLFNIINRPQWKYIVGGSNKYIEALLKKNLFSYQKNKKVRKIIRENNKIKIIFENLDEFITDKVIIATHADQAINLLADPSDDEKEVLSKFKYNLNRVFLHSDLSFMPNNKTAWSSWNFIANSVQDSNFSLTYWMNNLQNIKSKNNFFVTVNPKKIPKLCYDETEFYHPIYNLDIMQAQKKLNMLQGKMNTYFCGSYCGYGFHEDSIQSSAFIANLLGVNLPWKRKSSFESRLPYKNHE